MATARIIAQGRTTANTAPNAANQLSAVSYEGDTLYLLSDDGVAAANGNANNQVVYYGNADVTIVNGWPVRANDTITTDMKRAKTIDPSEIYLIASAAGQVISWVLEG